jgi:Short C-terminal domain
MVTGSCTVIFDVDFATICVRDTSNPVAIPYSEVRTLQFGGKGAFEVRSSPTVYGGGFGPVGILEGIALATVLSAAGTTTTKRVETIIQFAWTNGALTLVNDSQTPEMMAALLEPVVQMFRERETNSDQARSEAGTLGTKDLTSQLRELAELHGAGVLSDEEFALAKQRLLTTPN